MNKKAIFFCEVFFAILLILLFLTTAQAEIYKWKQGKVTQYSDIPPASTLSYEQLKHKKIVNANPQEVAPIELPKSVPLVRNDMPAADKSNTKKTPEQQEVDRKGREKSCATAKDNLQKLKTGGSIYKENTKGERTYLDEISIKNEITAAEKEIHASCQA
jgi:hypothetical protein